MVVISGSNTLEKRDRGFPQDMDQLQVVRPFTKWARSCHDAKRIHEYIEAAFRYALRGRPGPTYVEIPYNVMETRISERELVYPSKPELLRPAPEPRLLQQLAEMLRKAKTPIIIAGSGAFWSGADEDLLQLVQRTRMPLLLNNATLAMPLPADEYFGMGSPGAGRPVLNAIMNADLIVLLGTRLNYQLGFGQPPFISARQKVVQVDIAPEHIGGGRAIDLQISADVRATVSALNGLETAAPRRE